MSENPMPEAEVLKKLLTPPAPQDTHISRTSCFWAALRDAREATNRDPKTGAKQPEKPHGSWLGAVGYMVLLDQIGSCCFKPTTSKKTVQGNSIKKALSYFTELDDEKDADQMEALYALRCAFSHNYSLVNINTDHPERTHWFVVKEGANGNLVDMPKERWCGDYRHCGGENVTRVNLEKFGDLVEKACHQVLDLFENGKLEIDLNDGRVGRPDELLYMYSLLII